MTSALPSTGRRARGRRQSPEERRTASITIGVAVGLLLLVYWQILYYMLLHWKQVPDYNHGFLVAPLAVYFAWERRRKLRRVRIQGSWLGVIPLGIGLISLAVGRLGVELTTMRSGFVFTLIGLVVLLLGKRMFRVLAFPLLFLFLMVPLPQSLVNVIAFPLQLIAASAAVSAMHMIGIPVLLEGNIIHLAHTDLFVEQACSGLRSLTSLITIGVIFAYFFRTTLGERVILVASTIPIAIVVNSFRVALTGVLAHWFGEETATGVVHQLEGLFTFVLALSLLFVEAHLLSLLWVRLPERVREALA